MAKGPTASFRLRAITSRSPRQDEVLLRSKLGREAIHQLLQGIDVALLDLRHLEACLVLFRNAQIGAQVEQVVLDPRQLALENRIETGRYRGADMGVQLIDRAVRFDARRIFWHPPPGAQAGRAIVPGAGIDLCNSWHRRVSFSSGSLGAWGLPGPYSSNKDNPRRSKPHQFFRSRPDARAHPLSGGGSRGVCEAQRKAGCKEEDRAGYRIA